ncbi:TetR/AcrR family transcriptional regulator [Tamaricihabitans halophyticus]|uniref:TetR/AcrR family transcriptional regulator n=1 Tax=Tamaricihabitans halophyticus TaxID=1262583 RepID=UPI001FB2BBB8|nr:TetR/AcrR family transcriptional regulator [Tamaricihabitans halophyticus]
MPAEPTRTTQLADAAIAVLAEHGMRGLTHRAVDRTAGLPIGSTSYYARTRAALLELTMDRMVELDFASAGAEPSELAVPDIHAFGELVAGLLHSMLTTGRVRMLARYEFALEGTRRPELRAVYDRAGTRLREPTVRMLRAAGAPDPQRQARTLVAFCEGILFDSIAGVNRENPPELAELLAGIRELLHGMLHAD